MNKKKTLFLFLNRLGQPDLCRPRSTTKRCSAFSCFVLSRLWNRGAVFGENKTNKKTAKPPSSHKCVPNERTRTLVRTLLLSFS